MSQSAQSEIEGFIYLYMNALTCRHGAPPIISLCTSAPLYLPHSKYVGPLPWPTATHHQALVEEVARDRYDGSVLLSYAIGAKRAAALGCFIGLTATIAQISLVCVLW